MTHAVLGLEEKEVYVGGFEAEHQVLRYSLDTDSWIILPRCPVKCFDIAYFRGKLIAVGGLNDNDNVVGTVHEFYDEEQKWLESDIPPMPTARSSPTVVIRQGHSISPTIAACGGLEQVPEDKIWRPLATGVTYMATSHSLLTADDTSVECGVVTKDETRKACNTVEVYSGGVWRTGVSLPHAGYWMSSVIIQSKCYLMGGYSYGNSFKNCIFADLDSLMTTFIDSDGASGTISIWNSIEDILLKCATAARLGKNLVAVGGQSNDGHTSTAIHILTVDGSWKQLKNIVVPEPCERAAVINLPTGELMIIGGSFHHNTLNMDVKKESAFVVFASTTNHELI